MTTPVLAPPDPGRTVLACHCGKAIDTADMQVVGAGQYGNGDPKLGRIVCPDCATNRAW